MFSRNWGIYHRTPQKMTTKGEYDVFWKPEDFFMGHDMP